MSDARSRTASQRLSAEAIATLVEHLPDYGSAALVEKAEELECPIAAAIVNFLDDEACGFEDCLLEEHRTS